MNTRTRMAIRLGAVGMVLALGTLLAACTGSTPESAPVAVATSSTPTPSAKPAFDTSGLVTCQDFMGLSVSDQGKAVKAIAATGVTKTFSATYVIQFCGANPAADLATVIRDSGWDDGTAPDSVGAGTISVIQDSWTDDQGYSYAITVGVPSIAITPDVANALPGQIDLTLTTRLEGQLENTTVERNAPIPESLLIEPVWAGDSAVCALTGQSVKPAFSSNLPGMEARWCTLSGLPAGLAVKGPSIPVGASATATAGVVTLTVPVPEASVDALTAALGSPALWAFGRSDGGGLLTDCLMRSGGSYVTGSTADAGCAG